MGIEFQEEKFSKYNRSGLPNSQVKNSLFVRVLITNGIVKDVASANIFLTVMSLLIFALSIYVFIFGFSLPEKSRQNPVPPDLPSGLEI